MRSATSTRELHVMSILSKASRVRRRPLLVLLAVMTVAVGLVSSPAPVGAEVITGSYRQAPQVVQFNAYGGKGDATVKYNPDVWYDILDSIGSREPKPYYLSLNEVCQKGRDILVWVLNSTGSGYTAGNPSGYTFHNTVSIGQYFSGQIGVMPLDACGDSYGNMLLMRGTQAAGTGGAGWYPAGIQSRGSYGELRNWMCRKSAWSGRGFCTSHTKNGCTDAATVPQIAAYRDIAGYASGSGGVYALGDLNCEPYLSGWQGAGFNEIELPEPSGGFHPTTDGYLPIITDGDKLDYIWRRNTPAFAYPPYIVTASASDHHWVQGYI